MLIRQIPWYFKTQGLSADQVNNKNLIFKGLALVILCSSENEERAHIVASLEEYKKAGIPRYPQPEELRRYLEIQFKAPQEREGFYHEDFVAWRAAAEVGRAEK